MTKPAGRPSNFVSDQHTLYCGWVMGLMVKAGLPFEPVADEHGNFTNRVSVPTLSGVGITLLAGQAFPDGLAISPVALLLAAAFAVAIGLTAGVYPALRASRLTPVDAIRAL